MRIIVLSNDNQYASKRYFASGLTQALQNAGVEAHHFVLDQGQFTAQHQQFFHTQSVDWICSFNETRPDVDGNYFWQKLGCRMIHFLVDNPLYFLDLIQNSSSFFGCVDIQQLSQLNDLAPGRGFFFPHAIDTTWSADIEDKSLKYVFFGSSIDPNSIEQLWKSYPKPVYHCLKQAQEQLLHNPFLSILEALQSVLLPPEQMPFSLVTHLRELEWMQRACHRIELLNKIEGRDLHIFGEPNVLFKGREWAQLVPNASVHPAVDYEQAFSYMKKARCMINSSPFFPHGSHERVFLGMQSASAVLTSPSTYIEKSVGDRVLYYDFNSIEKSIEALEDLLADSGRYSSWIQSNQEFVLQHHSWDLRASSLIGFLQQFQDRQTLDSV